MADEKCAIVTSANLTDGGLFFNYEFGVWFDDPATVRKVREDAEGYASLGGEVLREELAALDQTARELQRLHEQADRQINARLKIPLAQHLCRAQLRLLRVRARGKTTHGIFADALLYLLRPGPRRTTDLHRLIQQIHPDQKVRRLAAEIKHGRPLPGIVVTAHSRKAGQHWILSGYRRLAAHRFAKAATILVYHPAGLFGDHPRPLNCLSRPCNRYFTSAYLKR